MDQITLVDNQIKDGERLVAQLAREGFEAAAAGWVKTSEDGQWFLYIASPVVDDEGGKMSYRRVHSMIRQMPQPFWIDPFEVKLIGMEEPITEDVLKIQHQYSGKGGGWYRGTQLGGISIEGAYIYPPIPAKVR